MAARSQYIGWSREDRDLLIELRTEVKGMRSDINDLRDNTASRLSLVEQNKMDRNEAVRLQNEYLSVQSDHEKRIRDLETQVITVAAQKSESDRWTRIGGAVLIFIVGVIEFLINKFL